MALVCLPSDALSQHLPSYLAFYYLGRGVSLHSCSSKAQLLLLTLEEGYLLMASPPDLEGGVASLGPPGPLQLPLLGGEAMLPKSLIQSSIDGWGCVPSLLFDLGPNFAGGNEDNGDLFQKVPCKHCCIQCP